MANGDPRTLHITQSVTYRCQFQWLQSDGTTPAPLSGFHVLFELLNSVGEGNEVPGYTFDSATDAQVSVEPSGHIGQVDVRLGADLTVALGPLITKNSGVYALLAVSNTDPTEVELIADGPFVYILEGS